MSNNAALAYQNNKISTSSPGELTLMLYEGAIKFCNIAMIGIENNDMTKINNNIIKAEKIVMHLRSTLDFKYPVAQDFENVYKYVYDTLISANITKDKDKLLEALGMIREMRDTWKEVIKQSR
ncbi:MAG: flagellar export chaperone FliS [Anaerocolumna sp.]